MLIILWFIQYIFLKKVFGEVEWDHPNIVLQGNEWQVVPKEILNPIIKPHLPYNYNYNYNNNNNNNNDYDIYLKNDTTIIVLIASYRETRCPDTLFNFINKAAFPKRIFIGVVQQNEEGDPDCYFEYCKRMNPSIDESHIPSIEIRRQNSNWKVEGCPFGEQIKMLRMHARQAKGPVYARAQQVKLVENEAFCMQIDAHTDVVKNWDILMLKEWGMCQNEYAIISTYPSNIKDIGKNSNSHWEMPHLCDAAIVGLGQIRNAQARAAANLEKPIIAPLWAAGLSFSRCHAELRVPNDPNLKHVFNGEEFSRGARLWTHGYDFYSPRRAWVGTWYQSEKGGLGHWNSNGEELQQAHQRMATLLKFPESDQSAIAIENLGRYNVGNIRSFEQYVEFSGVNTITQNVDMNDKCIRPYTYWNDSIIKNEIMALNKYGKKALLMIMNKSNPQDKKFLEHVIGIDEISQMEIELEKELLKNANVKGFSGLFSNNDIKRQIDIKNILPFMHGANNELNGTVDKSYHNIGMIILYSCLVLAIVLLGYLVMKSPRFRKCRKIKMKSEEHIV